jgi:DegV family protein with EDD domain
MTVAIVTDTTHYLPPGMVSAGGVREVSLYVRFGDEQHAEAELSDLDAFYDRLRDASTSPTTSQPSVGDFLAVYEPLLAAGHDIVSVHLSAAISGTYESALRAKAQLAERGLGDRIEVFDSATTAGGLGIVVLGAAAAASAGADLRTVLARAQATRAGMRIWFGLDTLEYLRRGGRIGGAQAWIGGALKIKPILSIESEIVPVERVRTSARAFERMVAFLQELRDDGADAWIVQHIQVPDEAQRLVARGREIFGSEPLFVSEVGPVVGAHTGPGLVGVGGVAAELVG